MNDRIPGSAYHNPIWYKDYRIYLDDNPFGWAFVHKDYDGDEDERFGYGKSVDDCKEQIDLLIAE